MWVHLFEIHVHYEVPNMIDHHSYHLNDTINRPVSQMRIVAS